MFPFMEDIACAILARPDFTEVDRKAQDEVNRQAKDKVLPDRLSRGDHLCVDGTALHLAAAKGRIRLCRAIIERADFAELSARWSGGKWGQMSAAGV